MSYIREQLPAAIRAVMQDGLLERTFQDALLPEFLFPTIGELRPWAGEMGAKTTFTRDGLLTPKTTSLDGGDPTPEQYAIEQYNMVMEDYGHTIDVDKITSSMNNVGSLYLRGVQKLGINAGQSLNRIARNKLYKAYAGGTTWLATGASGDTTIEVESTDGFEYTLVNGVPTPVSGSNALNITVDGDANTVTGVDTVNKTLTVSSAVTKSAGVAIVAANAPYVVRAGTSNDSAYDVAASDVATLKDFRKAVTRLRLMNVPTIGGNYIAHIDPETESQLYNDEEFQKMLQSRVDSPIFRDLSIGVVNGIDFVRNNEVPTVTGNNVTVKRPIVMGAGALINGPYSDYMNALRGEETASDAYDIREINAGVNQTIALITRPPQDRMARKVAVSWGWIGDYGVPTDSTTGDAALFKRAVVVEHGAS